MLLWIKILMSSMRLSAASIYSSGEMKRFLVLCGTVYALIRCMMVFFVVSVCMWLCLWSMPWTISLSNWFPMKSLWKKQPMDQLMN